MEAGVEMDHTREDIKGSTVYCVVSGDWLHPLYTPHAQVLSLPPPLWGCQGAVVGARDPA